jgi:hypothetical protein
MMKSVLGAAFIALIYTAQGAAASLTILAVTPFGETISACVVESFEAVTGDGDGDYKNAFQGSIAERLPLGTYDALVRCGHRQLRKRVELTRLNQIELLSQSERVLISDHVKPVLSIKMKRPVPATETWWIRLIGIYNGLEYLEQFVGPEGKASIIEPESGSYIVAIQSTTGYSCIREVDLVEHTRQWTILAPSTCSFELDRFAHLVQESEKKNPRQGRWYDEMRQEKELLFRGLREAADKTK